MAPYTFLHLRNSETFDLSISLLFTSAMPPRRTGVLTQRTAASDSGSNQGMGPTMPNSGTLERMGIEALTGTQMPSLLSTSTDGNNNAIDTTDRGGTIPIDDSSSTITTQQDTSERLDQTRDIPN